MKTWDTMLAGYAADLNDKEFKTYTPADIARWHSEAMGILKEVVLTKTADLVVCKVEPCSIIQTFCEFSAVYNVIGSCDKDGNNIEPMKHLDGASMQTTTGRSSVDATKVYPGPQSWYIDPLSNALFIYPVMPANEEAYVLVSGTLADAEPVAGASVADLAGAQQAMVVQYVLGRAKQMDKADADDANASARHFELFFKIKDELVKGEQYRINMLAKGSYQ